MNLFEKFSEIINKIFIGNPINADVASALVKLNPDKIYLENVRSLLHISHKEARRICEAAVRQGLLYRIIEVLCPDGHVAVSRHREEDLPETVSCWEEIDGHYQESEFSTVTLRKLTCYALIKDRHEYTEAGSKLHRTTAQNL